MARLNSWLSPDVMQALGWALIHALWQCLALAAIAAVVMALSRRANVRYLVGVGALAAMLATPVATLLILASAHPLPARESGLPPAIAQSIVSQAPAAVPFPAARDAGRSSAKIESAKPALDGSPVMRGVENLRTRVPALEI